MKGCGYLYIDRNHNGELLEHLANAYYELSVRENAIAIIAKIIYIQHTLNDIPDDVITYMKLMII